MTSVAARLRQLIEAGDALNLESVGGEDVVLADPSWCGASVFGDVTQLLVEAWPRVRQRRELTKEIANGLRTNNDPFAVGHALDAIGSSADFELRPVVLALDLRVRDQSGAETIRVMAVTGIVRYALRDSRWRAMALAAVHFLEDLTDEYAASMVARVAAFAWTTFRDDALLGVLERNHRSAQAAYERGIIEMGLALEQDALGEIAARLERAEDWLAQAIQMDAERRDAATYLGLSRILRAFARKEAIPAEEVKALRNVIRARAHFEAPAPGWEWLQPPAEADLQWIPLVDSISSLSDRYSEPSWLDAYATLGETLKLYSAERAVQPGLAGVERIVKPVIEAAFIRERGLLAHLKQWIERGSDDALSRDDADRLRRNIDDQLGDEGKARWARAAGEARPQDSSPD